METLKIKKVGEFQIFDGFDLLAIDPEMTRIANKKELSELPEQIAVNEKVKEKSGFLLQKTEAKKNAGRAHRIIENEKALLAAAKTQDELNLVKIEVAQAPQLKTEALKKVEQHSTDCDKCDTELSELNIACDLRRKKHISENLIYSHPPANQIGIFDGLDIEALKEQYKNLENQQIVIESKTIEKEVHRIADKSIKAPFLEYVSHRIIEDFRGKQYFYYDGAKWIEEPVIEILGATKNTVVHDDFQDSAIEKSDLSPEQSEDIRMQNLTPEQKEAERLNAIEAAKNAGVSLRFKLEGDMDPDALVKQQAFVALELEKIEVKYA